MSRWRHFVGIDWSGAVGLRQKGIAVGLCTPGCGTPVLIRTDGMWSRAAILEWLRNGLPPNSLVGLDLGLSLPFVDRNAFFPGWRESPEDARDLWAFVDQKCDADPNLSVSSLVDHPEAARHFRRHGGRTGDLFGAGRGRLRATELAQRRQGLNPYSNLNLVGAAQVGKSSLTGMRVLNRLNGALTVWPFDMVPSDGSAIVEIYTSIAAIAGGRSKGRTKMTSVEALNAALTHPAIGSEPFPGSGAIDDHSADALLSAAWLRANADREELWHPSALTPHVAKTEGWTFGVV